MNIRLSDVKIGNLTVEIIKKDIKNLHLGVYPPKGRVRVAAPLSTSDESIRLFVISKMLWIKKQEKFFLSQQRQTARKYVSGETHYIFGKAYRLRVINSDDGTKLVISKKSYIDLYVKSNANAEQKAKIFENYYRSELRKLIFKIVSKWEKKVGVKTPELKIRKMKTRWGTCNSEDKRIWLNLELAKKPFHCIDYVLVHELIHLKEKKHSKEFLHLLQNAYPNWQEHKDELNHSILSHSEWGCESNSKLKNIITN
jgi:predicted metal-dependent hydrolase